MTLEQLDYLVVNITDRLLSVGSMVLVLYFLIVICRKLVSTAYWKRKCRKKSVENVEKKDKL